MTSPSSTETAAKPIVVPEGEKLFVCAGSYLQYVKYCETRALRVEDVGFINNAQRLFGYTGVTVILTGTYRERNDWRAVQEMLKRRDCVCKTDPI